MGSQPSIQFPKNTWYQYKKTDNCKVYHNGNSLYAQKRQIIQDKKIQVKQELLIYKTRCDTDLPIVKVYNVLLQQQKKNFCSMMQKIILFVQYCPNRLSHIKSFTLPQTDCLYVLRQCIKAFNQLFKKFGYFEIKADMIGFNSEGKVKCWINTNFSSNRIENADHSIISIGDGDSSVNISKLDHKLRESIQKGMVTDIWQVVKKKSNIKNKDLYNQLETLETSNFQKAQKIIEFLINNNISHICDCLYFQNCLQNINLKHKQFNYGQINDQQTSKSKVIQLYGNDIISNGFLNQTLTNYQPNIKDFDKYREHIQGSKPKKQNQHDLSISFQKPPKKAQNPEQNDKKKIGKHVLSFVDRTIDISLSSIPYNSNKMISLESEQTEKRIDSAQNIQNHQHNLKKTYSCFVPNAVSQRYILNQIPQNRGSSRIVYQQMPLGSPRQLPERQMFHQNFMGSPDKYPTLSRKMTSSRLVPPPPIPGVMRRQPSIVGFINQPNTPQFNKISYH